MVRKEIDSAGVFAIGVVPGSTGDEYLVQGNNAALASFDDIGGFDAEIKRIKDMILLQARHSDFTQRYGLAWENTILLAGKTGSGKTMLAQATCRFLGELTGDDRSRFMFVGPGDLQDMWYGQTQKRIAAKLKPHNCRDYLDLPDDMDVVKVEPVRRLKTAHLRSADL